MTYSPSEQIRELGLRLFYQVPSLREQAWITLSLSYVQLFATPWAVACQAPPSNGIFQARILEWVAVSFSRGSSSVIELRSPALQADFLPSELPGKPVITFKTQLNNSEDS